MMSDKRELRVFKREGEGVFRIGYEGGGETPAELQGAYTTSTIAQLTLDLYTAKKNEVRPEDKPDSEKDIIELLTTPRPRGRPANVSKR